MVKFDCWSNNGQIWLPLKKINALERVVPAAALRERLATDKSSTGHTMVEVDQMRVGSGPILIKLVKFNPILVKLVKFNPILVKSRAPTLSSRPGHSPPDGKRNR